MYNAFWNIVERTLSFGEGGGNFRSLASVDVVAHEFGHGITHFQIGWNSTTDQRAFNEGMSDIWGVIMEHRICPSSIWEIGEQLTKNYGCLRNIQNTNASNAMSKTANTFGSTQYNSGDSYVRGGVFSHWFYLLVNGEAGVNDLGRSYTVNGVGMDVAEDLIVNAVFNGYLRNTTTYQQIRTSIVNAAKAMAGVNSFLVHQVENAWYAVGVGDIQYQYSISGPSTICDQATYTVNNLPGGAAVQWSVSVTNMAMINPVTGKLTQKGNGKCFVKAKLSFDNNSLEVSPFEVWVGAPAPIDITLKIESLKFNGEFCVDHPNAVIASHPNARMSGFTLGYEWQINNDWQITEHPGGIHPAFPENSMITVTASNRNAQKAILSVRARSECGWGNWKTIEIMASSCYRSPFLSLYPNPGTTTVTIQLDADDDTTAGNQTFFDQDVNKSLASGDVEIQLWSAASLLKTYKTDQTTYQFSVSDLPKGIYFVRVIKDGRTYTQKLIKN